MSSTTTEHVDRKEFLNRIPSTITNRKADAPSTLECKEDMWGFHPEDFRYVNIRDEAGNIQMREDNPEKPQKQLRLIGQPHLKWEGPYVQVRVGKDHAKWFKHLPVALELAALGKLVEVKKDLPLSAEDQALVDWMKAEAKTQFLANAWPILNAEGKTTRIIYNMTRLGIIAKRGDAYVVKEEVADATQAVTDAETQPVVAGQPFHSQEPVAAEVEVMEQTAT